MSIDHLTKDPGHWQRRAEEIRVQAQGLDDPDAKEIMLRIALSYDFLAKRAQERLIGEA